MPLPESSRTRVQAPACAGVGLVFEDRVAEPSWPADWWQRNYDAELDAPDPVPLTEREQHVPPAPEVTP
jgi:hypothetical protein